MILLLFSDKLLNIRDFEILVFKLLGRVGVLVLCVDFLLLFVLLMLSRRIFSSLFASDFLEEWMLLLDWRLEVVFRLRIMQFFVMFFLYSFRWEFLVFAGEEAFFRISSFKGCWVLQIFIKNLFRRFLLREGCDEFRFMLSSFLVNSLRCRFMLVLCLGK